MYPGLGFVATFVAALSGALVSRELGPSSPVHLQCVPAPCTCPVAEPPALPACPAQGPGQQQADKASETPSFRAPFLQLWSGWGALLFVAGVLAGEVGRGVRRAFLNVLYALALQGEDDGRARAAARRPRLQGY